MMLYVLILMKISGLWKQKQVYQKQLWQEESDKDLKKVEEEGVKVSYPDKEPFREKVKKMLDSYQGTEVGELVRQIQEVQ